jgi:hypothetical protein
MAEFSTKKMILLIIHPLRSFIRPEKKPVPGSFATPPVADGLSWQP